MAALALGSAPGGQWSMDVNGMPWVADCMQFRLISHLSMVDAIQMLCANLELMNHVEQSAAEFPAGSWAPCRIAQECSGSVLFSW